MSTVSFGDKSRLIIKNIPNSLDAKSLDKLINKKCKEIGVNKCDVRLLTKEKNIRGSIQRISRGICYVGFISEKDATKFLNHYNNSYFNSCKVSIEYSKSPSPTEKHSEKVEGSSKVVQTPNEDAKVVTEVVPRKAGVSSKKVHIKFDSDSDSEHDSEHMNGVDQKTHPEPASTNTDKADVLDMNRVVIFNLPYTFTEEMIRKLAKPYGKVEQIHIPLNNHNFSDPLSVDMHATKGMCFVTFSFESDALKFVEEKNKSIFLGRIITVALANSQNTENRYSMPGTTKYHNKRRNEVSFEKFKKHKKIQESTNADIWNILHIDISAAINAISMELEIEQDELLKDEEAGVNVALSEAYILNQIKTWMTQQGINYEVKEYKEDEIYEDILLIKNLPYNSDDKELIQLFSGCGQIIRFTISPFKLLGLVQFSNKFECDKALRTLSYRMYRNLPIYLQKVSKELLPSVENVSTVDTSVEKEGEPTQKDHPKDEEDDNETTDDTKDDGEEHENRVGHVSVYVSNLDGSVEEDELDKHFGKLKGFVISKIIKPTLKTDVVDGTIGARTRYGFIEFDSIVNAKEAIKRMTGTVIAGKVINLEMSRTNQTVTKHRRKDGEGNEENEVIVVKNVPFQANKKEVLELFKYHANVKTVRMPKSAGNTHRGFAFVEFVSKNDAKLAMENLSNVHLYGRRLVLQYAEQSS